MFCDTLTDSEFIEAFETATIPNHEFRHIDHIRMSYLYLTISDFDLAAEKIVNVIKNFANAHNLKKLYHQTITWFWIYRVSAAIRKSHTSNFKEFFEQKPELGNKNHIFEFYSTETLMSDLARKTWVAPDKRSLEFGLVG